MTAVPISVDPEDPHNKSGLGMCFKVLSPGTRFRKQGPPPKGSATCQNNITVEEQAFDT